MLFNDDSMFETMLDVIPFGIYVVDVKTYEIVYMNRSLIKSRGNFIGKICHRALYEEDRPCLFCKNKQLVNDDWKPTGRTIVFEHFNEMDDCWYQLQEKGMVWPDGRTVKYSIAVEISELKLVQNQLAEAHAELALKNRQLESATQAKSMFLASMSHEIRTPMNAIMGLSDLALKADMSPKVRDYLKKISLSAKSLLGIINDILDFSKIEAGRLDLEDIPFLLPDVLGHLSGIFHFKTAEKGIEFIISMAEDVPWGLCGDPTRLGQVLTNLVSNAVKFTASGEIIVRVSVSKRSEKRIRLAFSVADTGIGIPENKLDKLFDSFTQVDGSTNRKYGGTGLGLSICKRLVEKMGGRIRLDSREGRGSQFTFDAEFGLAPDQETAREELPPDLTGLRVLVADDHPVSLAILEKMLFSLTFQVTAVSSGEDLLERLNRPDGGSGAFDLIITDWKMGGMDGMAVCAAIRRDDRFDEIPIILVSGFDSEGTLMGVSKQEGVNAFLPKPVNPSSLFDTLMEVFGRRSGAGLRQPMDPGAGIVENIRGAALLLVDDNEINRQVARELLNNAGFRVDEAETGDEAFQAVQGKAYDGVLMDIQMPGMNGYETTRKIRHWETGRTTDPSTRLPVIAMTAHALEGDREKSLTAGMDDHVTKPIDSRELFSVLAAHIRPGRRPLVPDAPEETGRPETGRPETVVALHGLLPGIDTADGIRRVSGNTALYQDLLLKFAEKMPDLVVQVREAAENKETETAEYAAHTLKGLSGNIGAHELYNTLVRVEQALVREDDAACRILVADLEAEAQSVLKGIEAVVKPPSPSGPAADAPPPSSEDFKTAEAAVQELRRLLTESNGLAIDQFKAVKDQPALKGSPCLAAVEDKIRELDFEAALERLDSLEKVVGKS